MSEFGVAGGELKKMIKVAKKGPIPFGFNPGKNEEEAYLGMHRTKAPAMLGKDAKESGEGGKFSFGTAKVEGKVLQLTCQRELPGMAKRLKKYLKSQKVMLNVEILNADGELLESDIEEDLPDDPDLMDDDEQGAPPAAPPPMPEAPVAAAPQEPVAEPQEAAPDASAVTKRLGAIRGRIQALPPESASRVVKPFQQVVEMLKAGEVDRAAAGADKLEAALTTLENAAPVAAAQPAAPTDDVPPPPPPPDPQLLKLGQMVKLFRDRAAQVQDAQRRTTIDGALDKVDEFLKAGEVEKAMGLLKKLQDAFKNIEAAAGQSAASPTGPVATPTDTAPDGPEQPASADEQKWASEFARLERRVLDAMSGILVQNVEALRQQWKWATTNAADGAYDKALAVLPQIEAMLEAGRTDGGDDDLSKLNPEAKKIAAARIRWIGVRASMRTEMRRLEDMIRAAISDDEDAVASFGAEISSLSGRLSVIDTSLEDKLDEIVGQEPGPQREKLKADALKLVADYQKTLETDFFNDVDQGSGFGSVSVSAPARAALGSIAKELA